MVRYNSIEIICQKKINTSKITLWGYPNLRFLLFIEANVWPWAFCCLPEPSVQISEATSEAVSTILAESLNLLRRPIVLEGQCWDIKAQGFWFHASVVDHNLVWHFQQQDATEDTLCSGSMPGEHQDLYTSKFKYHNQSVTSFPHPFSSCWHSPPLRLCTARKNI